MRIQAAVLVMLLAAPAFAVDAFEVQVYEGDHNAPKQVGLEAHLNSTYDGRTEASYPGELPPKNVTRLTFEPSLGVTDWLELGAYLQGMMGPDGSGYLGGFKLRAKFIFPTPATLPCTFGINVEVGRVAREVEEDGWANEFRPIAACEAGDFTFALNPIVGFALTGPDAFQPDFEPAARASWNTNLGFGFGVEFYAGLGLFKDGLSKKADQEQLLFGTFDLMRPRGDTSEGWELNLGVGGQLGPAPDRALVVKLIVGHTL